MQQGCLLKDPLHVWFGCDLHVLLLQWNMTMWIPESCKLPWRRSASKGCIWQARSMAPLAMKRLLHKGWLPGLMQLPQVTALPILSYTPFSFFSHSARCSVSHQLHSHSAHTALSDRLKTYTCRHLCFITNVALTLQFVLSMFSVIPVRDLPRI